MEYDKYCEKSIETYGKKLENNSLKNFNIEVNLNSSDKGIFNKIVEESYFKIKNNNLKQPDFIEAGLELKVVPLKRIKIKKSSELKRERKGLSMKERASLSMINYKELSLETWENNSLSKKAFNILFCFYIYEKEISQLNYLFDLVNLWKPSQNDLNIIKDDWDLIQNKVKNGLAHEISEGDTLYLGACTKGGKNATTTQPYSDIIARKRAFSFKQSYMNIIYEQLLNKKSLDLKSIKEENKTLEESLYNLYNPFLNKSAFEIANNLQVDVNSSAKSFFANLSKNILKIEFSKIEEFKKGNICIKTIRVNKDNLPFESISFPKFDFLNLINEDEWEESALYEQVTQKFLLIIFGIEITKKEFENLSLIEKRKQLKLKKIKLISLSDAELEEMNRVWSHTKQTIINGVKIIKGTKGNSNNFIKSTNSFVGHVRPHANNNDDVLPLPDGRTMPKQSFWLNANFIKNKINKKE